MNKDLDPLLVALAEKLGTTVEHLWGVLITQARMEALGVTSTILFFTAVLAWASVLLYKLSTDKKDKDGNLLSSAPLSNEASGLLLALVVVGWFLLVIAVGFSLPYLITCISNPEYWALDQVLGLLRN